MILTEEQRDAIEYAISTLEQCGYEPEDLVVVKILQAMIDSSEHIREPPKMVGFDLEKARAMICHHRIENPGDADTDCGLEDLIRQANLAEEALDEIERLREALDESEQILAHKTKTSTHWYGEGLQTRADLVQCKRVVEQQAARIQELEDTLVEERVIGEGGFRAGQCEFWYIEDLPEESCMELDGPCDWAKCPRKHELCDVAYQQLAEEGKIGPDAKPHCWQITEERKAAIDRGMRFLAWSNAKTNKPEIDIDLEVLRAMLTEAE